MLSLRHWCSASPRAIIPFILLNVLLLSFLTSLCRSWWSSSKWLTDSYNFQESWQQSEDAQPFVEIEAVRETITLTTTARIATVTTTITTTREVIATLAPTEKPTIPHLPFCDTCGPDDTLCTKYGKHNLAKSRLYEGTNYRFHRVIRQALAGEHVKIGVLGGSVTAGHCIRSKPDNWTQRFLEAWRILFPDSSTELVNGAVAATGSEYLSVCFGEHLDEEVDLILVELAINDQRREGNAHAHEWLIRSLLDMPKRPAVISLQTMALLFAQISMGGDLHIPIAQYYDTPVLSIRNFLVPHILNHQELDKHYFCAHSEGEPDWRHVNSDGHAVMADILVAYTQRQICAIEFDKLWPQHHKKLDAKLPTQEDLDLIPRIRLLQQYDRETVLPPFTPFCQSVRAKKHPLTPLENKGWSVWTYKGREDKPYFTAKNPGDYVKFEVSVHLVGRVRVTYLRSATFGLGDVLCWLDDDRSKGKKIAGWWNYEKLNVAQVEMITDKAEPGKHILTCEILSQTSDPGKGHEFRLIAIDAS